MKKEYTLAVDVLRLLAILAVILIHTTTKTLEAARYALEAIPFTLFFNQAAIFAVPLFFLISGFVLELNYRQLDYLQYFKKRATRIIAPYIFWSLFYFLVYPMTQIPGAPFWYLLITGQASYQLYFIPAIIIFYLLFPMLHKIVWLFSKWYVIFPLIFLQLFLMFQDYYIQGFRMESALRVTILSFVFFPLGMIASHHQEKILQFVKRNVYSLTALLLLCMLLSFGQSFWFYETTKRLHFIYSQYQPIVLPYTLLLASLVFFFYSQCNKHKDLILTLSKLSFFVFFVHVSVMYTFWGSIKPLFIYTQTTVFSNLFFTVFFFGFITTVSFLLAFLFHKIPYIAKLTG